MITANFAIYKWTNSEINISHQLDLEVPSNLSSEDRRHVSEWID